MRQLLKYTVLLCLMTLTAAGLGAEIAETVSPGGPGSFPLVESRCPTFSWTQVEGSSGYEIVTYPVDREALSGRNAESAVAGLQSIEPRWQHELPARASSWTPSGAHCLEPGQSYAWFVRALADGASGEWSEASLFEIEESPSSEEMRQAMDTLRELLEKGSASQVLHYLLQPATGPAAGNFLPGGGLPGPIPPIDAAAIEAELEDELSATAGVVGRSRSATGIAGVFQNSGDGSILSGQNATNEVFNVDSLGTVAAVAFVGDGSGLTGVGGGESASVTFAATDSPPFDGGDVLTLNVDAPSGGVLVVGAAIDVFFTQFNGFDFADCEIQVDDVGLTGSSMTIYLDPIVTNAQCTSTAATTLSAGMHTVDFNIDLTNTDIETDSATLWAILVP